MALISKALMSPAIKAAYDRVASGGRLYIASLIFFGVLLLVGLAAGVNALFITGTRHVYATYREIPVALLISTYVFFVVASTGICLVSSLGHVFGVKNFVPLAKRSVYLAIVTILAGFLVIGLEIEHPFRMALYNIISPNFSSNIWWMGTLYSFAVVFLTVEFIFLLTEGRHRQAVIAGFLGVVTEVAANSNLGGVFAMMHGRPFWYGSYFPVYFILSALITGCAFIIFFVFLAQKIHQKPMDSATARALESVARLAMLLLAVMTVFTVWKILTTSVGSPSAATAMNALLIGPYAFNFWVLEISGGIIIPFILFLVAKGKNMVMMFVASTIMIFSIFFMRLDMVVVGQIVPLYWDLGVVEASELHRYMPSISEILVVLGGIGFCALAFLLGEKVFDGFKK
ncbi:MAG TPA: polysulfide reductase NrfD [Smithellaceae bacterium]|nr:polysulfide reductase NrfD [Smithellaceae bacterium]HRS88426.1 polysulfide reductase NrfD [Smithellaceae bacterium]HRV25482.1 polysulfide reductase NrfD [Smithellaceae bacterium]